MTFHHKTGVGAFIVAMLLFSGVAQAQKHCTEIGCTNGLTLKPDPEFDWKTGNYDLNFNLGGKRVTCRGRLPLKPCNEGATFECGGSGVTITESGCALPTNSHAIGDIRIEGMPSYVILDIKRNGKSTIFRKVSPQYNMIQPNGPGCGPICERTEYSLMHAN